MLADKHTCTYRIRTCHGHYTYTIMTHYYAKLCHMSYNRHHSCCIHRTYIHTSIWHHGQFTKLNLDKWAQPLGDLNFQRASWSAHKRWFWDLRPSLWNVANWNYENWPYACHQKHARQHTTLFCTVSAMPSVRTLGAVHSAASKPMASVTRTQPSLEESHLSGSRPGGWVPTGDCTGGALQVHTPSSTWTTNLINSSKARQLDTPNGS